MYSLQLRSVIYISQSTNCIRQRINTWTYGDAARLWLQDSFCMQLHPMHLQYAKEYIVSFCCRVHKAHSMAVVVRRLVRVETSLQRGWE